jgi:hypothetical protein
VADPVIASNARSKGRIRNLRNAGVDGVVSSGISFNPQLTAQPKTPAFVSTSYFGWAVNDQITNRENSMGRVASLA